METTLRAIVDGMEHRYAWAIVEHEDGAQNERIHEDPCDKCRLIALLEEAEKVDLVKIVRNLMSGIKCFCYWEGVPPKRNKVQCIRCQVGDEVAQWLAVNLELVKAEARLEALSQLQASYAFNTKHVVTDGDFEKAYHEMCKRLTQRIAALEAQAQSPSER